MSVDVHILTTAGRPAPCWRPAHRHSQTRRPRAWKLRSLGATPLACGKQRIQSRRTAAGVQVGLVTAHQHHRAFANWMTWRMRSARWWRRRCMSWPGHCWDLLHGTKHSTPEEARCMGSGGCLSLLCSWERASAERDLVATQVKRCRAMQSCPGCYDRQMRCAGTQGAHTPLRL